MGEMLRWDDIAGYARQAQKCVNLEARPVLTAPVIEGVYARFGLSMANVFMLNHFMRAVGVQGRAMAQSAGKIHTHAIFEITEAGGTALAGLINQAWYSVMLELDRTCQMPFAPRVLQAKRWYVTGRGPDPYRLRWYAVAPTESQIAMHAAVRSLLEADVENEDREALQSTTYAEGLVAFTALAATAYIADIVIAQIQPGSEVRLAGACEWRDMFQLANLTALPDRWLRLCRPLRRS